MQALGLIETVGFLTAVSAADAAVKAANVEIIGIEKVIGVSGSLGVTIHFSGDVAAVKSAVDAGKNEAERVGKVISYHVIPRAHYEIATKLLPKFKLEETPFMNEMSTNSAGTHPNQKQNNLQNELDEKTNAQKDKDHEGGSNNG